MRLKGKKVLVTGAGGFIGSHLVEALLAEGCQVRAFVRYNSIGLRGWLDDLPASQQKEIDVVAGDVRDAAVVRRAVRGTDVVFHLAALIGIPYSYHAPESYLDTNVRGTLNVLVAARDAGGLRVLITSTSEVYGTARYVPIDEEHPRQPQSPYAASKVAADALAESFHRSYGLPVCIVRPFNTYGPRQSTRAVIPAIASQLLAGAATVKLGNLHPTRDLNYVKDTATAFVAVAKADAAVGQHVNIATGKEISVGDVAQRIIKVVGVEARLVCERKRTRPAGSEVERLCGSNAKIRRMTKWKPQWNLDEGLRETVHWLREAGAHQTSRSREYRV
jgi:NAD dependent epimerase/dehydratase